MPLLDPETFGWDLAILVLLCMSLAGAIGSWCWLRRKKHIRGTRIVGVLLLAACLAVFATVIYGSFVEPRLLVTRTYGVDFPVDEQLRIAVMSDIHLGPYKGREWVQHLVSKTNELLPDIVLLPGDFVLGDASDLSALSELQNIRTTMGVYAVLGNHDIGRVGWTSDGRQKRLDRGDDVEQLLTDAGVKVLRNAHVEIEWGDDLFSIAGIDDLWGDTTDLEGALANIPAHPVILLSHNPSIVKTASLRGRVALVVSGHTHAGQVRLPGLGPIMGIPTQLGSTYDEGYFSYDGTPLFITRGVGESGPRARLFAPPELSLLLTR